MTKSVWNVQAPSSVPGTIPTLSQLMNIPLYSFTSLPFSVSSLFSNFGYPQVHFAPHITHVSSFPPHFQHTSKLAYTATLTLLPPHTFSRWRLGYCYSEYFFFWLVVGDYLLPWQRMSSISEIPYWPAEAKLGVSDNAFPEHMDSHCQIWHDYSDTHLRYFSLSIFSHQTCTDYLKLLPRSATSIPHSRHVNNHTEPLFRISCKCWDAVITGSQAVARHCCWSFQIPPDSPSHTFHSSHNLMTNEVSEFLLLLQGTNSWDFNILKINKK